MRGTSLLISQSHHLAICQLHCSSSMASSNQHDQQRAIIQLPAEQHDCDSCILVANIMLAARNPDSVDKNTKRFRNIIEEMSLSDNWHLIVSHGHIIGKIQPMQNMRALSAHMISRAAAIPSDAAALLAVRAFAVNAKSSRFVCIHACPFQLCMGLQDDVLKIITCASTRRMSVVKQP
jgi:hypothetical protein